jgi:hypothetical protein
MAQPSPYDRAFNFRNWQSANPTSPLPGSYVDEELSRIKAVLDQVRTSIAAIQRDDYALANRSVGFDQLKTEVEIGINPPAPWATDRNYVVRDAVFFDGSFYICAESHVSTIFATDLSAGYWDLIAEFEVATSATAVAYDNSTSGLDAESVQAAIDEIANLVVEIVAPVTSFNGRDGAVVPVSGDYSAAQVAFSATGLANTDADDVQEAIADHDVAISGKANTSHGHAQSDITGLTSALAALVPASRSVATAGLATGGGDMSTSRTITVPIASEAQAQAGTNNATAMTPLRTAQAFAALAAGTSLLNVQAFTASGTYTPTSGATKALVFCTGGGGGGLSDGEFRGSGGGGGTAIDFVVLSGSVSVTIGAGGNGGSSTPTAGGTSSFGSFCSANGGAAGNTTGVNGGTATGGVLNLTGGAGVGGVSPGGASFWGGSGARGAGGLSSAGGTAGTVLVLEFA